MHPKYIHRRILAPSTSILVARCSFLRRSKAEIQGYQSAPKRAPHDQYRRRYNRNELRFKMRFYNYPAKIDPIFAMACSYMAFACLLFILRCRPPRRSAGYSNYSYICGVGIHLQVFRIWMNRGLRTKKDKRGLIN